VSSIETRLLALAHDELDWSGSLPSGALADHFDSMQLMTLVVAVEDRFEIVLEPEDEAAITTVDDLIATIERKTR
jgi:hypothetical protein